MSAWLVATFTPGGFFTCALKVRGGVTITLSLLLEAQVVAPPSPLAVAEKVRLPGTVGAVLVVQVQVKVAEPLAGTVWLAGLGPVRVAQL